MNGDRLVALNLLGFREYLMDLATRPGAVAVGPHLEKVLDWGTRGIPVGDGPNRRERAGIDFCPVKE